MQEWEDQFADFYYFVPGRLEQTGGLWPLRAGRNRAKAVYRVGPRQIECCSMHLIAQGELELLYGQEQVRLRAGDAFCLYPGRLYTYGAVPDGSPPPRLMWVAFQGPQAVPMLDALGFTSQRPCLVGGCGAHTLKAMEQLLDTAYSQTATGGLAMELLADLYRLFGSMGAGRGGQRSETDWLEACWRYMETHYTEPLSVDGVAARFGMHRSSFSTRFSRRFGLSPSRFLQRLRMEKGAMLLRDTEDAVTEIAYTLGYAELFAFTRAFRAYFGCSPRQFRAQNKNTI
ncbi:helix-turn-helix transcriptional regulator [Paenibacillus sp. IB182496]|uniref:Helix-turn-helix transcriptional regulator n=1 Tax=Paenibacillus sabuli TaxID=2772509 RepID=A0A927GTA2_9BACL|nr:helix-turn-helix domain-containing protein [Paenibacillus sabuli]MBD2847383.1 helix-turn-helix transcriptional regulator [Paenibacillus sabuli]